MAASRSRSTQRHLIVRHSPCRAGDLHRLGPDVHSPVSRPDGPPGAPLPPGVPAGVQGHVRSLAAGRVRRGRGVGRRDVLAFAALALNQITASSVYQGVAVVLIALVMIRVSLRLISRSHDFLVGVYRSTSCHRRGDDLRGARSSSRCRCLRDERWRSMDGDAAVSHRTPSRPGHDEVLARTGTSPRSGSPARCP